MSRVPDLDELVGGDLEPTERERLLRVHEALLAAGPPPEPSPTAAPPATEEPIRLVPRRRRGALLALAAALGILVFALGVLAGVARERPGTFDTIHLTGTPAAAGARATIELFDVDEAGNWPMEIRVEGLGPSPTGNPYELWLTSAGEPGVLCGSFLAEADGTTVVLMNAPYRLREFDGWVVMEEGSTTPILTT